MYHQHQQPKRKLKVNSASIKETLIVCHQRHQREADCVSSATYDRRRSKKQHWLCVISVSIRLSPSWITMKNIQRSEDTDCVSSVLVSAWPTMKTSEIWRHWLYVISVSINMVLEVTEVESVTLFGFSLEPQWLVRVDKYLTDLNSQVHSPVLWRSTMTFLSTMIRRQKERRTNKRMGQKGQSSFL